MAFPLLAWFYDYSPWKHARVDPCSHSFLASSFRSWNHLRSILLSCLIGVALVLVRLQYDPQRHVHDVPNVHGHLPRWTAHSAGQARPLHHCTHGVSSLAVCDSVTLLFCCASCISASRVPRPSLPCCWHGVCSQADADLR